MKNLFIAALLAFGLVSCSSCAKKNTVPVVDVPDSPSANPSVPDPPVPPPPATLTATNGNLEVTLPGADWKVLEVSNEMYRAFINENVKSLVLLARESSTSTYPQYILNAIRSVKDAGGTVVSSKQVTVNGHNFVLVESNKDNIQVFMWVTLEQNVGYSISCGGPAEAKPQDLCAAIANTVKIN